MRTIRLNRPERRNAMTAEMQEELIAAMEVAAAAPSCRVVVLAAMGQSVLRGVGLGASGGCGRLRTRGAQGGCGEAGEAVPDTV